MTIEEAIKSAEQGDIGAMRSLAHYYSEQGEMADADEWFEKAAEHGDLHSMVMVMFTSSIMASAGESTAMKMGCWELPLEDWQRCEKWATKVAGNDAFELKDKNIAKEKLEQAYYGMATCFYAADDYKNARNAARRCASTKAKAILADSVLQLAETQEEFKAAYRYFEEFAKDTAYATADKTRIEEEIYVRAVIGYAFLVTRGIGNGVLPNAERGFNILSAARNTVKDAGYRGGVDKALAHYRKKLFGGYTYVE